MADLEPNEYSSEEMRDMHEHSPSLSSLLSAGGLHEKIPYAKIQDMNIFNGEDEDGG